MPVTVVSANVEIGATEIGAVTTSNIKMDENGTAGQLVVKNPAQNQTGFVIADSTDSTKTNAAGILLTDVTAGNVGIIVTNGKINLGGLTPKTVYYVLDNGQLGTEAEVAVGSGMVIFGVAEDATILQVKRLNLDITK